MRLRRMLKELKMSRSAKNIKCGWQGPGYYSEKRIATVKNDSFINPKAKRNVEEERRVYVETEQEFNFRFGKIAPKEEKKNYE